MDTVKKVFRRSSEVSVPTSPRTGTVPSVGHGASADDNLERPSTVGTDKPAISSSDDAAEDASIAPPVRKHGSHPGVHAVGAARAGETRSLGLTPVSEPQLTPSSGGEVGAEPVVSHGPGPGRSTEVSAADGSMRHSHAVHHVAPPQNDTRPESHQTKFLAECVETTHHSHTVEEVERVKRRERHVNHVQLHYQPIRHDVHLPLKEHTRIYPQSKVKEIHASTNKDRELLLRVAQSHGRQPGTVHLGTKAHEVVDKGERVEETVHHHVINVVQPLVDLHEYEEHLVHSTIPIHEYVSEAPIIHEATMLAPISREEALERGILGSRLKDVGALEVLHAGECTRGVEGNLEQLVRELGLERTNVSPLEASAKQVVESKPNLSPPFGKAGGQDSPSPAVRQATPPTSLET